MAQSGESMHSRLDVGADMLAVGSRTRGEEEARWVRVGRAARRKVGEVEKIILEQWRWLGSVGGPWMRALHVWS